MYKKFHIEIVIWHRLEIINAFFMSPVSPGMVVAEGYRGQEGKAGMIFGTILSDCLDFFGKLF